MKTFSAGFIGILVALLGFTGFVKAQSVSIEMDSTRQSISGYGGMNMPGWIDDLTEDQTEKAFGNDPGQIGLTILRVRVPNDGTQFFREVPTALRATNHGAIVFGTPWSPPASLKNNNNIVGGYLLPENYGAFADHLLQFVSYMNDSGVPIYAVSIQNEPDISVSYESCDWTARQFIDFLEQQGPRFDTIKVIAPESFQFRRPLSDSILNDPEAEPHIDIIGGHIYGGGLFDYPLAREKGKEVWMTEHLTGSSSPEANTWALALALGTEITECMKANFNAYVWWYIRRFYGMITDGGNISKKGYVMSQFTKFIRPDAIRVDALPEAVSGINVSAYRTDSSLVIVIVNTNTTEVGLDFTIQNNIGIDTLTQFTTSETKNVVNDGGISITGDTFSATVDAYSVTTFTSNAEDGGKYNNLPPVADAGDDMEIEDTDGNGSEIVILDGTTSSDPDGTIVNYSWALNGIQIAWAQTYELVADIGEHQLVLTVADDDGAIDSDTLNLSINSIYNTEIWFEAECGIVGSTWEIPSDGNASNGLYVTSPSGVQSLTAPSADTADLILFNFHLTEAGPYKLWGRIITPTPDDDSYWVSIDDGTWALWNNIPAGSAWHWDDVHDQNNNSEVVEYELDTGYHVLTLCYREDGALLDKLYLTNTGLIPSGTGVPAGNCPEDTIPDSQEINFNKDALSVYPNPAQSEIQVSCGFLFNTLTILSIEGRIMAHKVYCKPLQTIHMSLNLAPGAYILILRNKSKCEMMKLLIR